MVALKTNAEIAAAIARAADDPLLAVAAHNAPTQTVVSGPADSLARVSAAAASLGIACSTAKLPHAFHNPLLAAAVEPFRARIAGLPQRPLRYPVYSAILGRFYRDGDDLSSLLARHLVMPVRFLAAIRHVYDLGASAFVECGGRDALVGLVGRIVPDVETIPCLDGRTSGRVSIELASSRLMRYALTSDRQQAPPSPRSNGIPKEVVSEHYSVGRPTPAPEPVVVPSLPQMDVFASVRREKHRRQHRRRRKHRR